MSTLAGLLVTFVAALLLGAHPNRAASRVPQGVRQIDVLSTSGVSRHVTDPAKVAKIVSWLDALRPLRRSDLIYCPMIRADSPTVRFAFRAADTSVLAQASVLDAFRGFSGPCNPIRWSIAGRRDKPLIGGRFLLRVQRLLGIRFG